MEESMRDGIPVSSALHVLVGVAEARRQGSNIPQATQAWKANLDPERSSIKSYEYNN